MPEWLLSDDVIRNQNMSVDRTIPPEIRAEIDVCLDAIERDNDVVIVLACESGSRA
jgi:hypothetical protein